MANHFKAISCEFEPLQAGEIPVTRDRHLLILLPYQVVKKPKSMVKEDIFPALFIKFPDLFAVPLCSICNTITRTKIWPLI